MNIGEKIKLLRTERKITQKELASKIQVSSSNVTKYEKNQLEPSLELIFRISKALDVPIYKLIVDNYEPKLNTSNFMKSFNTKNILQSDIDKLTECLILTVINKHNLHIDSTDISIKDKKFIFKLASSTVETYIKYLIENKHT